MLRVYVSHAFRSSFRSKALKEPGRIAIWNRNKIILGITVVIMVTDVALFIKGKYLLLIMRESHVNRVASQVVYRLHR